MSAYVIGIGGTGAKCVEALIHLCAAGALPDDDLYAVFVDPDRSNGSLERAETTLQQYTRCKSLRLGATDLFRTRLTVAEPDVWSPFGDDARPRLDSFFQYNKLKATSENAAHLFDVLYSDDEKQTPLQEGFRGHPSIGAGVMAATLRLGAGEPWQTFRDKIKQDVGGGQLAKVVLVGSIFGGTGASGLPTIARLIKDELSQAGGRGVRLGGVLVLPYFSFDPVRGESMRADSDKFLLSTHAALKYYHQQADLDIYDAVYLMGDESLSPVRQPSIGGRTQRNEPHYMELYAALACLDFFMRGDAKNYQMIARGAAGRVRWEDLPYGEDSRVLKTKVDHLARFAFAYLSSYYPALEDVARTGRGYAAPWYVDFFQRARIDMKKALGKELAEVKEYCENLLLWLAHVQASAKDTKVELVNYLAFSTKEVRNEKEFIELRPPGQFKRGEFTSLMLGPGAQDKPDKNALSRLWEQVCEARVRDHEADGVGKFIHALYRECWLV